MQFPGPRCIDKPLRRSDAGGDETRWEKANTAQIGQPGQGCHCQSFICSKRKRPPPQPATMGVRNFDSKAKPPEDSGGHLEELIVINLTVKSQQLTSQGPGTKGQRPIHNTCPDRDLAT